MNVYIISEMKPEEAHRNLTQEEILMMEEKGVEVLNDSAMAIDEMMIKGMTTMEGEDGSLLMIPRKIKNILRMQIKIETDCVEDSIKRKLQNRQ